MNDQWIPSLPGPPPDPTDPLPPANSWNSAVACVIDPNSPSITNGVVITGVPAVVGAVMGGNYVWSLTLNDGGSPPNFTIDHYDASGILIDHPLEFSGVDGSARFNDPVVVAEGLTVSGGQLTVPNVSQLTIPGGPVGSYLGSVNPTGALTWFSLPPPVIPADAPTDGQTYARQSAPPGTAPQWVPFTPTTGFLPLVGGTMTGGIYFDGPAGGGAAKFIAGMTNGSLRWALMPGDNSTELGGNQGSNFVIQSFADNGSPLGFPFTINRATGTVTLAFQGGVTPLVLNGPAGSWRSIAGQTNGSLRWQMYLGNPTGELGSNFGSNFQLTSYSDAGATLGTPLQIARATGVAAFSATPTFPTPAPGDNSTNGATTAFVTGSLGDYMPVTGGLFTGAVGFNVGATFAGPANISIGGGASGNVLTTNGLGTLSWTPPAPFPEAPTTGLIYGRRGSDASWQLMNSAPPVTVGDSPPASPQVGQLWWDSAGGQLYVWYQDANSSQWVAASSGGPTGSTTLPLMAGTAAVGTASTWARADHVHPTDTSRYAASNPSGYQTAAQVTASLGGYLPLTGGTLSGALTVNSTISSNSGVYGTNWIGSGAVYPNYAQNTGAYLGSTSNTIIMYLNSNNYVQQQAGQTVLYAAGGLATWDGTTFRVANLNCTNAITTGGTITSGYNIIAGGAGGLFSTNDTNFGLYDDAAGHRLLSFTPGNYALFTKSSGTINWNLGGGLPWNNRTTDMLSYNQTGTVGGNGAYANISDRRAKKGIADCEHGLDEILALKPRRFTRLLMKGDREEVGFVADEVQKVIPEAVMIFGAGIEGAGLDSEAPALGLMEAMLIPALVNAVKTLTARIEELEAKLA